MSDKKPAELSQPSTLAIPPLAPGRVHSERRSPAHYDRVEGFVEVGHNDQGEVVVNLDRDRNGIGHLVFSPNQARALAALLIRKAKEAEK